MATERMCPHEITLYNFVETDSGGNDVFQSTILRGVHANVSEGTREVDNPDDEARAHIFDELVIATSASGDSRTFLPYSEWINSNERNQHWTLNPHGKDYFTSGANPAATTSLPSDKEKFCIINVKRLQMGSPRMWHWKIKAR